MATEHRTPDQESALFNLYEDMRKQPERTYLWWF